MDTCAVLSAGCCEQLTWVCRSVVSLVSAQFHVHLGDTAGSWLCVCVTFGESPNISTATARFLSPTSNAQASQFLHIFSSMCHFPVDCSHPSSCEVLSVVFISSSPTANDAEHLFKYLLAICLSLEKCHFSSPCTFLYGVVFVVRLGEYFIHSEC